MDPIVIRLLKAQQNEFAFADEYPEELTSQKTPPKEIAYSDPEQLELYLHTLPMSGSVPRVRLKVRRIDEHSLSNRALQRAKELGKSVVLVDNAGGVANNYGYPADTEGCVVIATSEGKLWYQVIRLPANKVTNAGVWNAVTGMRGLFDDRFNSNSQDRIRKTVVPYLESLVE